MKITDKLTELERKVLYNLINSDYHDGKEILNNYVWGFSVTNGDKQLVGALSSCSKKGYVITNDGDEKDGVVAITELGLKMYKENN